MNHNKVNQGSETAFLPVLLWIPLILFGTWFIASASINRPASDDFEFLAKLRDLGFSGSIRYFYDHWNTRFMALAMLNVWLFIYGHTGTFLFYHLFSLLTLWFAFYRLTGIFQMVTNRNRTLIAGYLVLAFFFASFNLSHVFFWVNSSVMYLIPCIAFLLMLGEVLNPSARPLTWFVIIICALITGGSYEPLVFTIMVSSVVFLFYIFRKEGPQAAARMDVLKVITVLSLLMIVFAISYAGEGHQIRSSFLPVTTFGYKCLVILKSMIKMCLIYGPAKLVAAVVFCFPLAWISSKGAFPEVTVRHLLLSLIIVVILIFISLLPLSMIMSEMGPERAWTQITVYLVGFAALTMVWAGQKLAAIIRSISFTKVYVLILTTGILIFSAWVFVLDLSYTRAYDQRMNELEQLMSEKRQGTLSLEPLPETGILTSAEIETSTGHFTNRHLKNYLRAEFEMVRSE